MTDTKMKAPKGVSSANILGHTYEVPSDGVIKITSEDHVEVLRRHGFTDFVSDDPADYDIDNMDKDELIAFIEERGGDADGLKKSELKKLAYSMIED